MRARDMPFCGNRRITDRTLAFGFAIPSLRSLRGRRPLWICAVFVCWSGITDSRDACPYEFVQIPSFVRNSFFGRGLRGIRECPLRVCGLIGDNRAIRKHCRGRRPAVAEGIPTCSHHAWRGARTADSPVWHDALLSNALIFISPVGAGAHDSP